MDEDEIDFIADDGKPEFKDLKLEPEQVILLI
jgi:hypothetical protein